MWFATRGLLERHWKRSERWNWPGSLRFVVGDDMGVEAQIDYTTTKRVAYSFRTCLKSGPSGRVVVEKAKD
jgi:hypothetical protein